MQDMILHIDIFFKLHRWVVMPIQYQMRASQVLVPIKKKPLLSRIDNSGSMK